VFAGVKLVVWVIHWRNENLNELNVRSTTSTESRYPSVLKTGAADERHLQPVGEERTAQEWDTGAHPEVLSTVLRCEFEVGVERVRCHAVGAEEINSGCVGAVVECEADRLNDQRRGVNR